MEGKTLFRYKKKYTRILKKNFYKCIHLKAHRHGMRNKWKKKRQRRLKSNRKSRKQRSK